MFTTKSKAHSNVQPSPKQLDSTGRQDGKSASDDRRQFVRYDPRLAKKAALAEGKAKARVFIDSRWWFAPFAACTYMGITYPTLRRWKKACPWLNGQGIETRRLHGHFNRLTPYFSKDNLDRISEAQSHREPVPEVPDHVHIEDAARRLGISTTSLRRLMKARKVKSKSVTAKGSDGRARRRGYVTSRFVAECESERTASPPTDTLTVDDAADILGVGKTAVHWLIGQGDLTARRCKAADKAGHRRRRLLLSRAEVESLKETRAKRSNVVPPGGRRGRWQTAADILRREGGRRAGRTEVSNWLRAAHKSGALAGQMFARYYPTSGHGQVRTRLHFDVEQLDRILAGRKLVDVAKEFAQATASGETAAISNVVSRGRPPLKRTQALNKFCYEKYQTHSASEVMRLVNANPDFGPHTIMDEPTVRRNARRHAKKHSLPWPPKSKANGVGPIIGDQ